jgi:hypothetical protein
MRAWICANVGAATVALVFFALATSETSEGESPSFHDEFVFGCIFAAWLIGLFVGAMSNHAPRARRGERPHWWR